MVVFDFTSSTYIEHIRILCRVSGPFIRPVQYLHDIYKLLATPRLFVEKVFGYGCRQDPRVLSEHLPCLGLRTRNRILVDFWTWVTHVSYWVLRS